MVKVILTEIKHFECLNEKVEENEQVTKVPFYLRRVLDGQIHKYKYTNTQIHINTNTVFAKKF